MDAEESHGSSWCSQWRKRFTEDRCSCVPIQISSKPIQLTVLVDGKDIGRAEISRCEQPLRGKFPIALTSDKQEMEVTLEVDRTIRVALISVTLASRCVLLRLLDSLKYYRTATVTFD
jgi:hypothetical protein